ncbi:alpha/beta hydrolase family protein [Microlunatus sp. GCM10028923]|uniref:alpha/beta hydrolase family protein n=1 Tax=Microlunatus sp. GCM10028923 TaxID=3273400 RepID=UPI0036138CF6
MPRDRTEFAFGPQLDGQYDVADQLSRHVRRRTAAALAAGRQAKDAITSEDQLRQRQDWLRGFVAEALGDEPASDRPVPSAVVRGTLPRSGYEIEKLLLDCGDDTVLTANLYRPTGRTGPLPAVLFCCGHAPAGKAAPAYHGACAILARRGFVVLVHDTIGQGERLDLLDEAGRAIIPANVPQHNHLGVKAWWAGETPARVFVTEARRALDYLAARPEVDPERIAALGNSGGGTMVSWLALTEPRLAAVGISCFLTGIEEIQDSGHAQDPEQVIPGGVAAGLDHDDVLLAMVPRPTLVLSKNSDFFPVEGTVRTVDRARRWFGLAGAADRLRHVRDDGTHGLSTRLAEAAAAFFGEHLGAVATDVPEPELPATESDLRCTDSGQSALDGRPLRVLDAIADRFARSPAPTPEAAVAWLGARVSAGRRPAAELFPRWFDSPAACVRKAIWWSEADLLNAAVVFATTGPVESVEVLLLDRGTDDLPDHLSRCRTRQQAGTAVIIPDLRGVGSVAPRRDNTHGLEAHYGTLFRMTSDLIALGDSLAAGRIQDVLRVLDLITDPAGLDLPRAEITLVGHGHGAFLAVAAAALDARIGHVTCLTPPFDPRAEVAERFHGSERDAMLIIPGLARHAPPAALAAALGDRLRLP